MRHGGDIYRNSIRLDFSVNVNPFGIPGRVKKQLENALSYAEHYPDYDQTLLRTVIGQRHGVRSAQVLGGNGASEVLMAIMHGMTPKRILIPVPSYVGYEYVANAIGGDIDFYERQSEFGLGEKFISYLETNADKTDMVILASPNNPTGLMISIPTLTRILEICEKNDIYCLLDLCFLDLTDLSDEYEEYFRSHVYPHLIRVYGFTKTFAIPGLRLGYMIASEEIRDRIAVHIPEWNLSILAQLAGVACLEEKQYLLESRDYIRREREWMRAEFKDLGIDSYDSAANFIFVITEKPIFDILFHDRILIRDCDNFRGLSKGSYRIALKKHDDNEELIRVLRDNL